MTRRGAAEMAAPAAGGLLQRLMATVRPEFRGDVFRPARDARIFVRGECRLVHCHNMTSLYATRGLCDSHYRKWLPDPGRDDMASWLAREDAYLAQRRSGPRRCDLPGCNRSTSFQGLCARHASCWARAGRPEKAVWLANYPYRTPPTGEHDCRFPECPRWTDGPGLMYCHHHLNRWKIADKPQPEGWYAAVAQAAARRQVPHLDLTRLPRQVRLEMQYGLQCRHDEGVKPTPLTLVGRAVKWVAASGVGSLLELEEPGWRAVFGAGLRHTPDGTRDYYSVSLRFVLDTRQRLQQLLIAEDPWADQYPRDVWDLRLLGVTEAHTRRVRFGQIRQLWLREATKRWCRWRLARGIAVATVARNAVGMGGFAQYLHLQCGPDTGPADVTRIRIEAWLAGGPGREQVSALSAFLRDVHRHDWLPGLPGNAFIFHDDAPPPRPAKPRFLSEYLMRQLEAEANLDLFGNDDARLITRILINCGLRLKDARRLPLDCVVRDDAAAPYLAWVNHKIRHRVAFFPISQTLADRIAEQQRQVLARYPAGCRWLFPARKVNLDGSRPMPDISYRTYLAAWLHRIRLVDEHSRLTTVTPHQFRHTVATRLINADVPAHIVQQLLDHMSREMTAVYARLHDKTLRRHWENAVKINTDGQSVAVPADHPLAGAAWMRLSMVRAKVSLPNGYCGAPVQTDCEYANPCLDCRFFITTSEFLSQHRRQRDETIQLIDDAQQAGLARIAERNRRTLGKLDTIITALEAAEPGQILAGGAVEDLHAAG